MGSYKILIIEDDEVIAGTEKKALERWDYQVKCVSDFKNILEQVEEYLPDLILLDIKLPFYNGFYWCRKIRTISKAPVMFVSSADDNMNIVMAMDMGGDDFIAKPFDISVLVAKINALLRRTYSYQGQMNVLRVGDVVLNLSDGSISNGEKSYELTRNEFKILQILMENAGKTVSRDAIMMRLWEGDDFIDDNTLTVNVTRIRKKLGEIGICDFIHTKKGTGYCVNI